jgi:murein L,D-transpeptidase YcbB/YkuD
MFKKMVLFCFTAVMLISLSGCATFGKKKDLEIQGLKNQVSALESQLQSRDQELSDLRSELERTNVSKGEEGVSIEPKMRPNTKQIQLALKNAGYNPGKVDGRMGRQTREAIKAFQRANNLPVDGKVGKKTWELLRESLAQKTK